MSTALRITVAQFDEMIDRGDFHAIEGRVELIDGEIREMPPPEPPHEDVVDSLAEWSFDNLPRNEVRIRIQQSIGIAELDSVPVPDVAWLRRARYHTRRPAPADVLLVVEVSGDSLKLDRERKGLLYARAGLEEYWIVNLKASCVEVFRDPSADGYATKLVFRRDDSIAPLAFPDRAMPVAILFAN